MPEVGAEGHNSSRTYSMIVFSVKSLTLRVLLSYAYKSVFEDAATFGIWLDDLWIQHEIILSNNTMSRICRLEYDTYMRHISWRDIASGVLWVSVQ